MNPAYLLTTFLRKPHYSHIRKVLPTSSLRHETEMASTTALQPEQMQPMAFSFSASSRPVSELLGPLSQLRLRPARLRGVQEERHPSFTREAQPSGLRVNHHGDTGVSNQGTAGRHNGQSEGEIALVDLHPYTTALVTNVSRYVEPHVLPTPSPAGGFRRSAQSCGHEIQGFNIHHGFKLSN